MHIQRTQSFSLLSLQRVSALLSEFPEDGAVVSKRVGVI